MRFPKDMAKREGAIVKKGKEALKWIISLYEQYGLPVGLLPFQELIEVGYVERTGYMWVVQEKRIEHKFKMIGKLAIYDAEMSGYLEKKRIRKLKGMKARELGIDARSSSTTRPLGSSGSKPLAASPSPSPSRPLPP
ncbi:hypothetical protein NL676_027150 [Syzygium grande]|nr:hypothetical protein NL676_027150 [Syzygium grande]